MDRKTKADVKNKIMREAKRMAGSDRLTASDIEMARRKIMKPVKKGLGGAIAKGAKKLGMKVKTKLNERRMKKQLDKLGYDPDATSGPNTLSKIIEREAKKNRKAEGGMPESRIILPKRKTVVKPEVFSEKSDSGVKKKGSKLTIGKKILGVDVIGQAAQQKYTFPRGQSKRRTKSITASKQFGNRGSFGIEAYDSTSSNPMNRSKTKGIKGSLTLTFSEGGSVSRGGRAAIRGIKFTGVK